MIELLVVIAIIAVLMAILMPEKDQLIQIQSPYGALWPYVKDTKLYRCPTGARGEMLTYAVMDSMNGYGDGTSISFADGHSEHKKWKGIMGKIRL